MSPVAKSCGLVLMVVVLGTFPAWGQISPGSLSKAHSFLSSPTRCMDCHGIAIGSPKLKCLDCHREIRQRLDEERGLHATVLEKDSIGQDCVRCHSEHNGEDFNLVHWDPSMEEFDHRKTGYVLEGRHQEVSCKSCHNPKHITATGRRTITVKDLDRTFLGLSADCETCHEDKHYGQLGANCARCHSFSAWKDISRFDHTKAKFALSGAHQRVTCQECHRPVETPRRHTQYTGLAFDTCSRCHGDPHRGTFAAACQSCHSTEAWKHLRMAVEFDHSKTEFPLQGKHQAVTCSGCHRAGNFKARIAHQQCADCHRPDPHRGQFNQRADGGECSSCHNVEGFKPSLFAMEEHAKSQFPLEGRHAAVPCDKCHLPEGADTLFKIKATQCKDCHTDVHKGQFAGQPHNNRCEDCHTVDHFRPSTFTLARHNTLRFPLTGGHAAVACLDCHQIPSGHTPPLPAKYSFEDRACTACHGDPHRGQFAQRMRKVRADGSLPGCEACHTTQSWQELSGFDHATTSFPLLGAHRAVPCGACHRPGNFETTLKNVVFKAAPNQCSDCHEDIHGGQFIRGVTLPSCDECHAVLKWKPSLFNHETSSTFSLKGAHKEVPCALCHKATEEVDGRRVLLYRLTPRQCSACHGAV